MSSKGLAVVAIGGNALIRDPRHESIPDQYEMTQRLALDVAVMIEGGWDVVVTHGNGPQVGYILRRSEISIGEVPPVPMDYAGADIQGAVGYMFVKALGNEFRKRGIDRQPVALVTQVLVDRNDPAFAMPIKPIGSHMAEARAKQLAAQYGWTVREDAGRGWRRVVPSPIPRKIVEIDVIHELARANRVVVACGGGGIPVIDNERGERCGVEAVIDKDLAASLLARQLGAQLFVVSTGVERVAIHFNTPRQQWLGEVSLAELEGYARQGQFPPGSMGPKVEAVLRYLHRCPHGRAIITDPPNLGRALNGETGTHIHA
jgi:carbamate kinase